MHNFTKVILMAMIALFVSASAVFGQAPGNTMLFSNTTSFTLVGDSTYIANSDGCHDVFFDVIAECTPQTSIFITITSSSGTQTFDNTTHAGSFGYSAQQWYFLQELCLSAGESYSVNIDYEQVPFPGVTFTTGVTIGSGSPLPVELVNFQVTKQESTAVLAWETASETNTSYFAIQQSTDASKFTEVGSVNAVGESSTTQLYSYEYPMSDDIVSYYRLMIVDLDGFTEYSDTKSLSADGISVTQGLSKTNIKVGDAIPVNFGDPQIEVFTLGGSHVYTGPASGARVLLQGWYALTIEGVQQGQRLVVTN